MMFRRSSGRHGYDYYSKQKPKKTIKDNILDILTTYWHIFIAIFTIFIIYFLFFRSTTTITSSPSREEFTSLLTDNQQLKSQIDVINKQLQDNTLNIKSINKQLNDLHETVTYLQSHTNPDPRSAYSADAQNKILHHSKPHKPVHPDSDASSPSSARWHPCDFKNTRNINSEYIEDQCIYDFWKSIMIQPGSKFATQCIIHKYAELDGESMAAANDVFDQNEVNHVFIDFQFDRNGQPQKSWNLAKLNNDAVHFDNIQAKYDTLDIEGNKVSEDLDAIYPKLHEFGIDGFCFLGIPLFDKDQEKAVFYYGSQTGKTSGSGDLYQAELQQNGVWKVVEYRRLWTKG